MHLIFNTQCKFTHRHVGGVRQLPVGPADAHLELKVALHVLLEVDVGPEHAVVGAQLEGVASLVPLVELGLQGLRHPDRGPDSEGKARVVRLVRV